MFSINYKIDQNAIKRVKLYLSYIFIASFILIGCQNSNSSWYIFDDIHVSESVNDSTNISSDLSYEWGAIIVDIPLPKITSINGKAKLLRHNKSNHAVGYEIEVNVDSLKPEDIPEKYKQTKTIETDLEEDLEVLPLKDVVYELLFKFRMLDKDGFEFKKISSGTHNISSGRLNRIKSKTDYLISSSDASLIGDIELEIVVTKCISCN